MNSNGAEDAVNMDAEAAPDEAAKTPAIIPSTALAAA
jgi:hypothetical protein